MPADEERQVDDQLSHLRSDVDQVRWAEADAVRRRGQQRGRQQAAAGTLAVVMSVGVLGVAATGRFPGQDGQSPLITASQNDRADSTGTKTGTGTSTSRNGVGGNKDDGGPGTGTSTHRNDDPTSERPDTPTVTQSATSPTGSLTPTPTTSSPETPGPSGPTPTDTSTPPAPPALTSSALLVAEEMPKVNDSAETWSATGTLDSEGSTNASLCAAGSLAGLGAKAVARRDFTWGQTSSTVIGDNAVGVFETAEDAAKALESYGGWVSSCATWADSAATGPTDVAVDGGTARWWYAKKATSDAAGEIEVVGLVRRGTALSVIVWHQQGQDFSYETDPMEHSLKSSAARLAPFGS